MLNYQKVIAFNIVTKKTIGTWENHRKTHRKMKVYPLVEWVYYGLIWFRRDDHGIILGYTGIWIHSSLVIC